MHKNILTVIGITALFLGLAIQPSIAITPTSSEGEDDCNLCPKVSSLHLVGLKSLLNRMEKYDNLLSLLSKHNPEVAEKYQKFSDRNTILPESIIRESICNILALILGPIMIVWWPAVLLIERLEDKSMPLLLFIAYLYWFSVAFFAVLPGFLWLVVFRCYEFIEIP